jgi:hypothetical protein
LARISNSFSESPAKMSSLYKPVIFSDTILVIKKAFTSCS